MTLQQTASDLTQLTLLHNNVANTATITADSTAYTQQLLEQHDVVAGLAARFTIRWYMKLQHHNGVTDSRALSAHHRSASEILQKGSW